MAGPLAAMGMWWLLAAALAGPARAGGPGVDGGAGSSAGGSGDPARGRAIVANRQLGLCLLCHNGPFPEERFQGDLAPSLAGAGSRWTADELRQRLADPRRFNPDSIMPSFSRTGGLWRVAPGFRDRPLLSPEQIEDVVAFLGTLR